MQLFLFPDVLNTNVLSTNHYVTLYCETLEQVEGWATSIHDMASSCRHDESELLLAPLEPIQTLPGSLLKNITFESDIETPVLPPLSSSSVYQSRGWLHYESFENRASPNEAMTRYSPLHRIRLRYFILWGSDLCVYKHEVLADEVRLLIIHF